MMYKATVDKEVRSINYFDALRIFEGCLYLVYRYFEDATVVPREGFLNVVYDVYVEEFVVELGVYIPLRDARVAKRRITAEELLEFKGGPKALATECILSLRDVLECWLMEVDECPCDPWEIDNGDV